MTLAFALTFGLMPTPATPAVPIGQPIAVSLADGLDHFAPDVAAGSSGGAVIVWQTTQGTAGADIFARRFSPDGAPLGQPFRVNAETAGEQRRPAVAVAADGGFVVAWDTNTSSVWLRRFGPDGGPLGADQQVSTAAGNGFDADVAALPGGAFVVAWQLSEAPSGDGDSVLFRRFAADGTPVGGDATPYAPGADSAIQSNPALAASSAGDFALAWEEQSRAGDSFGVRLSRYDAAGAPVALAQSVAASPTDELRDPAVALDSAGVAVLTWATLPGGDRAASRIDLRRLDGTGLPLGPVTTISADAAAERALPSLAIGAAGAVAAWADATTQHDGAPVGLAVRDLDMASAPDGPELYPGLPITGGQLVSIVAVAPSPAGSWLAWGQEPAAVEGVDAIGSIYARRLSAAGYTVALPMLARP